MKKALILFVTIVLMSSFSFAQKVEKLGAELKLKEQTKVSAILANPAAFIGKTVQVEGKVLDVCSAAGCWMEIASDKADQKIKIKVKDGDIVFPMEAKGKDAIVEGAVYEIKLSKEDAIEYYKHLAEENGSKFDESKITGPVVLYQIKGKGAQIKG